MRGWVGIMLVTDPALRGRQVLLPVGVGRVQPGQPLGDGQVLAERLLRAARSPRACATSPTQPYATASSRCQPVFAGSSPVSRSKMASDWRYACSAAARSPRACATSPTQL